MSLANYTDLQAAIASWGHRTDLAALIPDFVALAEARIGRDLRLRSQVIHTTLSTAAAIQTVATPTDWLETENITLNTTPPRNLSIITPEQMDIRFPLNYYAGAPRYYTMLGTNLVLGPTPDAVYAIGFDYYQRPVPLATTATNSLLTNSPNLYLYAALHELCRYTREEDLAMKWLKMYTADKDQLQVSDDAALRSGSALRVKGF